MIKSIVLENGKEKEAMLKLFAFFDLFDFPLTLFELNKYLKAISLDGKIPSLSKSLFLLNELLLVRKIEMLDGFYFLKNRQETVISRRKRYNYSKRKIKIARRFARIFALLPYVRKVAVANSIGSYNLRDESDIDFFIISTRRRIFLSRLFCTGIAKILNSRPNSKTKKDKICLSFYLAENGPELEDLKLEDGDPYFDFWELGLFFIIDKNATPSSSLSFFDLAELLARKLQLMIMPKKLSLAAAPIDAPSLGDFGVVISRDILKMYLSDRRLEIKKRYESKLGEIL